MSHEPPMDDPTDDELWDNFTNGNDLDKLNALRDLGFRRLYERKWAVARDLFEQALVFANELGRFSDKYMLVGHIARTTAKLDDLDAALALFAEYEPIAMAENEPGDLAYFYRAKGHVYRDEQMAIAALECFYASLSLARQEDDWYGIAQDVRIIAKLHILLREYTAAAELLDSVIPDAEENCYILGVLMLMHTRAKLFIEVGENGRAVEMIRDAIDCDEFYPSHDENISMHLTLATALVRLGDFAEAKTELDFIEGNMAHSRTKFMTRVKMLRADMEVGPIALALRQGARARAHTDGQYHLANVADINIGVQLAVEGNLAKAEKYLRRALTSALEHSDTNTAHEARVRLAALLVESGRGDDALAELSSLADINFGDNFEAACRYRAVLGSAYVAAGQHALAMETVEMLFTIAPVEEHFAFLADAHYVVANAVLASEGRTAKWATHLGKSIAYLTLVGDDRNAAARSIDFLDEDFIHPERLLDEAELDEYRANGGTSEGFGE